MLEKKMGGGGRSGQTEEGKEIGAHCSHTMVLSAPTSSL